MCQPTDLCLDGNTFSMSQTHDSLDQLRISLGFKVVAFDHDGVKSKVDSLPDLSEVIRLIQKKCNRSWTLRQGAGQPAVISKPFRVRPASMPQKSAVESCDDGGAHLFGCLDNRLERFEI